MEKKKETKIEKMNIKKWKKNHFFKNFFENFNIDELDLTIIAHVRFFEKNEFYILQKFLFFMKYPILFKKKIYSVDFNLSLKLYYFFCFMMVPKYFTDIILYKISKKDYEKILN